MSQAGRISENVASMYLGRVIEYGETVTIFTRPLAQQTQDYITGRFG